MTQKTYYQDTYRQTLETVVVDVQKRNDLYYIALRETIFYPEGGGQKADKGFLNGQAVLEVVEEGGEIFHVVKNPMNLQEKIKGDIDWKFRYAQMQKHTAEHIVVGLIHQQFGFENVGFHMGDNYASLDINGVINPEALQKIEYGANEIILANKKINGFFPSESEVKQISYRGGETIFGALRLVEIEGIDICACCGLHTQKTGEVGLLKIIEAIPYKKGMRITIVSAMDAYLDYVEKHDQVIAISQLLSAKPVAVQAAVFALRDQLKETEREKQAFLNELLDMKADALDGGKYKIIIEDLEATSMRFLVMRLVEKIEIICIISPYEDMFRYCLGSQKTDMRPLAKKLNETFAGKGGGSAKIVQGSVAATEESLIAFLEDQIKNM